MKIICDSREQAPFLFEGFECQVATGTLNAGDYSLHGFADRIAVERKELGDLISCLTAGRERFVRELERLRGYESAVVVVEAPFNDISKGNYRSKLNPESAVQSVISIMQNYRMPFFFAKDRTQAEEFTFHFLRHYHRHALERWKKINEK